MYIVQALNTVLSFVTNFLKKNTKELSFCPKLKCSNPYISATRWCTPLIFQT